MSVKTKTAKKIGLITAISIFVSSLIGIGIFFKNNTVFKENGNNPYGVLISWIVASIISLLTAFSFAEVGFNHRNGAGLGGATERMYGKKAGRFISLNNAFFYWGILNLSLAIFAAESLVKLFYINQNNIPTEFHMAYVMLIALVLLFIFVVFNYWSLKWSGRFQVVSTIIKFIPLIMVGLAGIIYGSIHTNLTLFDPSNTNNSFSQISIEGILGSVPSILFAYDSFVGVASLKGELKNPERNVPLTIILGMGICVLFYIFITIGQIMVSEGIAQEVFNKIFENNLALKNAFTIVMSVFIFVCVLGTLNALCIVGLRVLTFSVEYRIIVGYWWLNKYVDGTNKPGLFLSFIIYGFWWLVLLIPSSILNSDMIVDGVSNFPTLFMFAVYATLILKAWINRFTKKIHTDKMPGFVWIAPIAVLGCYLAFGYQFFWNFSIKIFLGLAGKINLDLYPWGLFVNATGIEPIYAAIVFFVMLIVFIAFPFINDALIKLKYKKINVNKKLFKELII
ncbi:MAG: APC family permease [Ureaplasma sp.]|nr:APC family permease [Ureaplasma sp.]